MRSLVTGGAGFIGSNLVDALVERGDDVAVLDNLSSGKRSNLHGATESGARLTEGDVTDAASVQALFEAHRPQQVFHLAAQIDVRVSVTDPNFDLSVNAGGTINLLNAAADSGCDRFVLASTGGAIYGEGADRDLPLPETTECRPDAPYGLSKFAAERYLDLYARSHGLSTVALRLGNVYGPRQDPHGEAGVVAIFCRALMNGVTPKVFGDGKQTRDYIYVEDVIRAFLAAAESSVSGAFNIGTGREASVLDLGRAIAASYETTFEPEWASHRPGEVQRIAISPERAKSELGWSPEFRLENGLRLTAAWARDAQF
jgi:UDP-glucose 4-epimerase